MITSVRCLILMGTLFIGWNTVVEGQEITQGDKHLPMAGKSFQFNGHDAFLIIPEKKINPMPWVWYAPTLKNLPGREEVWMFERFLEEGIAIAGIDVGESYGSPKGTETYGDFYQYLTADRGLSQEPVLLARSRGGLMLYNWAVINPAKVKAIAGIYPVCNLISYPGLERAKSAYGLTSEEMREKLPLINPIDRLSKLADHRVPILHLHGDQDSVVPLESNSAIVQQRYQELGAEAKIKLMVGQGHNMWSGWFQDETLTEFIITRCKDDEVDRKHRLADQKSNAAQWLHFSGKDGAGEGKHIVLIAAEQEYRSEQALPMLAKVLAYRHGFDCTVLFSVNSEGEVDPTLPAPFKDKTKRHSIPGLHLLSDADCLIWMSRFMQLEEEQLDLFYEYFDSGKPLIALRTANHGFWGAKPYQVKGQRVSLRQLLGGAFMSHHGGWHREATLGIPVNNQLTHPILMGVEDVWGTSDVYRCHDDENGLPADCVPLLLGQPTQSLDPNAGPNTEKKPLPIGWTKVWEGNQGHESKIFHFTMGSAEDFANEGVRRVVTNAVYWGVGISEAIDSSRSVEPVDPYIPLPSGFNYEKLGVAPKRIEDYRTP